MVTLVALLYIVLGILMALAALALLLSIVALGPVGLVGSAIPGIGALICFVIALGFLKGWKAWWYLGLIFSIIGIVVGLFSLPAGIIGIIINIVIIYYLFRPNVKSYFLD
ncbi:MAG: hypothetical protein IKP20_02600 [Candidatus Methanomethylophilaceae archaeon]|jgi:hypothetical protein|nr:hypothetical protein [Candidatus Methanomethylophilaceae archaeon]